MGGMRGMGGGSVPNGASLLLMTARVARRETVPFRFPARLSTSAPAQISGATLPPRRITLGFWAGQWQLSGRTFAMTDVAPDEIVGTGASQIWEVANVVGMMGMQMAHPFHVHGTQFTVLSRERANAPDGASSVVRAGLVDAGWRDTVLVMPGETVRLQMAFTTYPGLYLYHCHILEHEDMGMMRNVRVVA
jgi:FtsP/CotA-like multicopper oxidase with cupredoxin domain